MTFTASYTRHTLNFKQPAGTSRGFLHTKKTYFLQLKTVDQPGYIGWGECSPQPGLSLDGRPDFEDKLNQICQAINQGQSLQELDLTAWPSLAFGLEMAWRDWHTGGKRHLFDTPFSRGERALPIHGLIWMSDRRDLLEQVQSKVAQGATCIKMKVGTLDFSEECQLLADLRRHYPAKQISLRLDANGAFSPEDALTKLTALAHYDIEAIEQPLKAGQWEDIADLCTRSPIPIALDEDLMGHFSDQNKQNLLKTIRPHYLVLKPTLLGGFAAAETWIKFAETLDIGWWINSMLESNLGLSAIAQWTAHLINTLTNAPVQGLGTGQLYTNNIPTPLSLVGSALQYDHTVRWDFSGLEA